MNKAILFLVDESDEVALQILRATAKALKLRPGAHGSMQNGTRRLASQDFNPDQGIPVIYIP